MPGQRLEDDYELIDAEALQGAHSKVLKINWTLQGPFTILDLSSKQKFLDHLSQFLPFEELIPERKNYF